MVLCPIQGKEVFPIGVFSHNGTVFLLSKFTGENNSAVRMDASTDGFKFEFRNNLFEIGDGKKTKLDLSKIESVKITETEGRKILTYKYPYRKTNCLYGAVSSDFTVWKKSGKISSITENGSVISNFAGSKQYVSYFGEKNIGLAVSSDLTKWKVITDKLLAGPNDFYGESKFSVGNVFVTHEGIVLLYYSILSAKGFTKYSVYPAVFDKNNPGKLLKKHVNSIFESPESWVRKKVEPVGIVWFNGKFISYWASEGEGIYAIKHDLSGKKVIPKKKQAVNVLKKSKKNPILKPNPDNDWESRATFNPAAVYDQNKVHLVYRAIGDQDVSVLGYAVSRDGVNIDERGDKPIYVPTQPFEMSSPYKNPGSPSPFTSGGGCFGGCEDPRITKVEDKFYMTYVAYNGWAPPRVAITSIKAEDFLNRNWNWEKPVLISKPGIVDKNACLLPEKINGKYVMFHRIFPNILIDYIEDLHFDGSTFLKGEYMIEPNYNSWDSRKVGVGAPPIKTEDGWLVIYHAVGEHDGSRYKMGAMVLDHNDPTKVLYRTKSPILEPHEWYENEGFKAGVAYPCGAVALDKDLHIYYGGADTVVCVASANIHDFLTHIKTSGTADLVSITG